MADKTTPIPQMSVAQSDPSAFVNGINDAASPSMLYGRDMLTTIGLTFGYLGGHFNGNTIASGTVSLTNSATNYLVADRATGAVSVATNTTNWDNVADYMQLHSVVTAGGMQADWSDLRQAYGGLGGGGGATPNYWWDAPVVAGEIDLSDPIISTWLVDLDDDVTDIILPTAAGADVLALLLLFQQDGFGGHTVAGWPGGIVWESGSAPTIDPYPNAITSVPVLILGSTMILGAA